MDTIKLSKTLSHALRHAPWQYELELDEEGWTDIEDVLGVVRATRPEWSNVSVDDLIELNEQAEKQRFEIEAGCIRALYGHSVPGKLKKTRAIPPNVLFHGTSPKDVGKIRSEGLKPMGRQYVHLSVDEQTALEVGKRKEKKPIILRIEAAVAHECGIPFYTGNEKVWLADSVPPEFIGQ